MHHIDLWEKKKLREVWDMKKLYWSLLKSCWLKSGRRGRSIMVHQWMHPDKVSVRYNNAFMCEKKEEEEEELQPLIWSTLLRYQLGKMHRGCFHVHKKQNFYKIPPPRHDFKTWKMISRSHKTSLLFLCSLILPCCWKRVRDKDLQGQDQS